MLLPQVLQSSWAHRSVRNRCEAQAKLDWCALVCRVDQGCCAYKFTCLLCWLYTDLSSVHTSFHQQSDMPENLNPSTWRGCTLRASPLLVILKTRHESLTCFRCDILFVKVYSHLLTVCSKGNCSKGKTWLSMRASGPEIDLFFPRHVFVHHRRNVS